MPKRKTPKPQQSVQLSAVTRKQMRELAALWGMPETRHSTAVIRRAVEIAHDQTSRKETKMIDELQPYKGQMDIPVKLACGCETKWHDGFDLHPGVYAWCDDHGDTTVAEIYAEPTQA